MTLFCAHKVGFTLVLEPLISQFHCLTAEFFVSCVPIVHLVTEQGFTKRSPGYWANPSFQLFQNQILGDYSWMKLNFDENVIVILPSSLLC